MVSGVLVYVQQLIAQKYLCKYKNKYYTFNWYQGYTYY